MIRSMDEERLRVLQMLKDGKITPEEAVKLIEALESTEESIPDEPVQKARWLRVRVTDMSGKPKVMVNLPMTIVDWALRVGSKVPASYGGVNLAEMGIDLNELRQLLCTGFRGKIVDVEDEDEKQHVEVIIE